MNPEKGSIVSGYRDRIIPLTGEGELTTRLLSALEEVLGTEGKEKITGPIDWDNLEKDIAKAGYSRPEHMVTRITNVLHYANISTYDSLLAQRDHLKQYRGCGKKAREAIGLHLRERGILH